MKDIFDQIPFALLNKMRDLVAREIPDADGNVTTHFRGKGPDGRPLSLTVNHAATLACFDSAVDRRTPTTPQVPR